METIDTDAVETVEADVIEILEPEVVEVIEAEPLDTWENKLEKYKESQKIKELKKAGGAKVEQPQNEIKWELIKEIFPIF